MFQKTLFTALLSIILITVSCAQDNQKTKTEGQFQTSIVQKSYRLKGFKQSCCFGIVEYALKEVKGYQKSEANVKKQELTVWFDSKRCSEVEIKNAINQTAYKIVE
jgi:copper chaperone CopZ